MREWVEAIASEARILLQMAIFVSIMSALSFAVRMVCGGHGSIKIEKFRESSVIAVLFTVCAGLSTDWLGAFRQSEFWPTGLLSICGLLVLYQLVRMLLNIWYQHCLHNRQSLSAPAKTVEKSKYVFVASFLCLWITYFVFFLNQYPGSLSCDTPAQLAEAMGTQKFENANPFVNTLLITFCVRPVTLLTGNVNKGIACYTCFQFTLVACAFAYTVSLIYRKCPIQYALFAHLFYNFMPYNIVYAIGMWKDTFFAFLFLLTLAYAWEVLEANEESRSRWAILLALVVLTSLARNSGWSSLLIFGAVLYLAAGQTQRWKKVASAVIGGVVTAVFIMAVCYPLMGIHGTGSAVVGLSVPIQQVARVAAQGGSFTQEEEALILQATTLGSTEQIARTYDEGLSDPMKWVVKGEVLQSRPWEYCKLWISLGIKHPKTYLDAYVKLMGGYWDLRYHGWLWDTRIFANDFGVKRMPKLFAGIDLVEMVEIYKRRIPAFDTLERAAFVLWTSIVTFGCAKIRKDRLTMGIVNPIFMIFTGLLVTSPASLFRYTYCAAVCVPLVMAVPNRLENQ